MESPPGLPWFRIQRLYSGTTLFVYKRKRIKRNQPSTHTPVYRIYNFSLWFRKVPWFHAPPGFKRLFGLRALVKRQVQPFSLALLLTMINLITSGDGIPGWCAALTACMAVLIPFVVMTGTRKDEFSKDGDKNNDYLRRSNFQWMDGDREIPHSLENLRALPPRAFLRGQAGPSKCDRYLQTWGARLQWFQVQRNDANPLNFASAWRR